MFYHFVQFFTFRNVAETGSEKKSITKSKYFLVCIPQNIIYRVFLKMADNLPVSGNPLTLECVISEFIKKAV